MTGAASTLAPRGPAAQAAADLWWLMLVLGVAVFVVFAALLAAGLLRRHRDTLLDDDAERRVVRRWIVGFGVGLPLLVIPVVFGATIAAMRGTPIAAGEDALRIEVVGHQYWYEIRYPDHARVTANELHVPVGREVALELSSRDVIHSFWVPALGGKLDMLPDHPNTLVLEADEAGVYRGQCAEFCGLQHARMELLVVAHPPDAFETWLGDGSGEDTTAGDARGGAEVFDRAGCAACHAPGGGPGSDGHGPSLDDLAARRSLAAGMLPNTRGNAAAWIRDPQAIKPGVDMPAARLSDDELDALLDHLGYPR